MPQDIHDYQYLTTQLGGIEGQATPTVYSTPGVMTTVNQAYIAAPTAAQFSTQTNPGQPAHYGINSIVQNQQNVAVAGPIYQSPGGILNKAQGGGITTGGGP